MESGTLERLGRRLLGDVDAGARCRKAHVLPVLQRHCPQGGRVLDAGCGHGDYALALAAAHPHATIEAVDVDPAAVRELAERARQLGLGNVSVWQAELGAEAWDGHYSLVYCVDVFEHVTDDRAAFAQLAAMLEPGGHLVVHVPAEPQRRWMRRFEEATVDGHVRDGYSPECLRARVEEAGLRVEDQRFTFGRAGSLAWELNRWSASSARWAYPLLHPAVCGLVWVDGRRVPSVGNGLRVVATKPRGGSR